VRAGSGLKLAVVVLIGCSRPQGMSKAPLHGPRDAGSAADGPRVTELTVASDKDVGIDNTVSDCVRVDRVGRRVVDNLELIDVELTAVALGADCGCLSSSMAYEVRDEVPIDRAAPGEPKVTKYLATYGLFVPPGVHQRRRLSVAVRADTLLTYAGRVRLYLRCAPPL
jgi:hypothetical protein